MSAHDRIHPLLRQVPDVLAHVTVRQNTDQPLLINYWNLSESAGAASSESLGSTVTGFGVINEKGRSCITAPLSEVRTDLWPGVAHSIA